MKTKIWDDEKIAAIPSPRKAAKVYPLTADGLKIRVQPSGFKSFGYIARNKNGAGHPQFYPIGEFGVGPDRAPGALSFAKACLGFKTRELQKLSEDRFTQRAKAQAGKKESTFAVLLEDFMENVIDVKSCTQLRKDRWRYVLTTHFLNQPIPHFGGKWGELRLSDFVAGNFKKEYATTLKKIQQKNARGGSRRGPCTLADITDQFAQKMFEFGAKNGYLTLEDVPERLEDINKARVNNRYQSIAEIERLLKVTSAKEVEANNGMKEFDAMLLRLLLLTGVRLKPMRLARYSDIDSKQKGFWTFPAAHVKQTTRVKAQPEDHLVPITGLLRAELKRLKEVSGDYPVLFPERWAGSRDEVKERSEGWAKHVVVENAALLKNQGEDAYATHALRRTMNNVMRDLNIPDQVIHVCSGRVPKGVDATYLTTKLRPQCIIAYEKYHAFLQACMQGKGQEWMDEVTKEKRQALRNELDGIAKKLKLKPIAGVRV